LWRAHLEQGVSGMSFNFCTSKAMQALDKAQVTNSCAGEDVTNIPDINFCVATGAAH
jgi:hypothetical protein